MRKLPIIAALAWALATPTLAADYVITAPQHPRDDWRQTAQDMRKALQAAGISEKVEVANAPGQNGGAIGLARFIEEASGDPSRLFIAGQPMIGAMMAAGSDVDLGMLTPIARLTSAPFAIVAPASGPLQSVADLAAALQSDPGAVVWGAGLPGSAAHTLAGRIAKAAGADPARLKIVAGAGAAELSAGMATVGILDLGGVLPQAQAGALTLLAVSSAEPVAGVAAPTLRQAGIDVALEDWSMAAAGPGLSEDQIASVSADIERMARSEVWLKALADRGLADGYLAGPAFQAQLDGDIAAAAANLKDAGLMD